MPVAHIPGFGGGVVLEGSVDTRRTDELAQCDNLDIGQRGELVISPGLTTYLDIKDPDGNPLTKLFLIRTIAGKDYVKELYVGQGFSTGVSRYLFGFPNRSGEANPYTPIPGSIFGGPYGGGGVPVPRTEGVIATVAQFPGIHKVVTGGVATPSLVNIFLVNLGAREAFGAGVAPGLYAVYADPAVPAFVFAFTIDRYDSLGTGERGEYAYGTGAYQTVGAKGKQLRFRGIAANESYAFGWGHDQTDNVDFDGPSRVMFSNPGKPLVWGNDNIAAAGLRDFSDTDAFVLGDLGETVRAGLSWNRSMWFGTNRKLHQLTGFGRDTWTVDGARAIPDAENVISPHCLIEGPDRLLYGVSDQGLWSYDGGSFERWHMRLRNYKKSSPNYFDLIWTDRSRSDVYPGKTNADLCWTVVDWDSEQVIVGIPFCNASQGYGFGTDTVLVKFNTRTKGFSRQIFRANVIPLILGQAPITTADFSRARGQYPGRKLVGRWADLNAVPDLSQILTLGEPASIGADPPVTPEIFAVTFGTFALAGPDGSGVAHRAYLTLSGNVTMILAVNHLTDTGANSSYNLYIQNAVPAGPNEGDYWVDTSLSDTNLGNATAGAIVVAWPGSLLKLRRNGAWQIIPEGVTISNAHLTIRLAFRPVRATRQSVSIQSGGPIPSGPFQIEGFAVKPEPVTDSK